MSSSGEESDLTADDYRTPEQLRYDAICDQVREVTQLVKVVIEKVPQHGAVQTVIHKTQGMGVVGVICAVVSVCCMLMMIGFGWLISIELNKQTAELHDLRAWRDIHQNHISAIEAREEKRK